MTEKEREQLEQLMRNVIYAYGMFKEPRTDASKADKALTQYMSDKECNYEQVMRITQCVRDSVEMLRKEVEICGKRAALMLDTIQSFAK